MIKQVTNTENLWKAYRQVFRNKGVAGVDKMPVKELLLHFNNHKEEYIKQIENGNYQPSPIKGVEIPKANGKKRLLGISTVIDRMFQQALHQVMQPVFEPDFQNHSYGFRPKRNAHQAITQSLDNINSGYQYIVDIDLKSFFDEVEHHVLLERIP